MSLKAASAGGKRTARRKADHVLFLYLPAERPLDGACTAVCCDVRALLEHIDNITERIASLIRQWALSLATIRLYRSPYPPVTVTL